MSANTAVCGTYKNRSTIEEAVDALKQEGFRNTDISVLFPGEPGLEGFCH